MTVEMLTKRLINESGWSPERAPKFAKWWMKVDELVQKKIGLSVHSIGDWDYSGAFEDGMTPASAAKEVAYLFQRGEL